MEQWELIDTALIGMNSVSTWNTFHASFKQDLKGVFAMLLRKSQDKCISAAHTRLVM